jgi:hypothetical protein
VNTSITDVNAFLDHIVASTNMKCLTPPRALEGECGYLAANLYARCGPQGAQGLGFQAFGGGLLVPHMHPPLGWGRTIFHRMSHPAPPTAPS